MRYLKSVDVLEIPKLLKWIYLNDENSISGLCRQMPLVMITQTVDPSQAVGQY